MTEGAGCGRAQLVLRATKKNDLIQVARSAPRLLGGQPEGVQTTRRATHFQPDGRIDNQWRSSYRIRPVSMSDGRGGASVFRDRTALPMSMR